MKVNMLMSTEIVSIPPKSTLLEASKLMKKNRISSLPIMKGKKPIGIVTTTDLMNIYTMADQERHLDPWTPITEYMTSPVITIKETDSVKNASEIMKKNNFHHLLVVDESEKLVGIISALDIMRAMENSIEQNKLYRKPADINALLELTVDSLMQIVSDTDLSDTERSMIENVREWGVKLQPQFMHLFEAPMDDLDFKDILRQTLKPVIDSTIDLAKSDGIISGREQKIIDTIVGKLNL